MDEVAIEAVVNSLQPYPYGWRQGLPASYRFLGQPLALTIETRPFPADFLAPRPTETELDLVRLILGGLSALLIIAEREYATYNASYPELLAKVYEPRVWVCREFQQSDGPDRWALTSGIADAPDWTIFVEFRRLAFIEIWSGD